MPWPKVVPILTEDDICRGVLEKCESRCLRGWAIETFGGHMVGVFGNPSVEANKVLRTIRLDVGMNTVLFNDSRKNSLKRIAAAWNRAVRKLGYTVSCDREAP